MLPALRDGHFFPDCWSQFLAAWLDGAGTWGAVQPTRLNRLAKRLSTVVTPTLRQRGVRDFYRALDAFPPVLGDGCFQLRALDVCLSPLCPHLNPMNKALVPFRVHIAFQVAH